MEDQDAAFIKQATEAIVDVSLNIDNIDPIIKELLERENALPKPPKSSKSKPQDRRNSTGEKRFKCAKCSLEFSRSSDLRRHEKTHFAILPNICPQCGKGFARKDALKRHYDTLTCRRNRTKLLTAGGEGINELLKKSSNPTSFIVKITTTMVAVMAERVNSVYLLNKKIYIHLQH
ncbi:C2H2-type zinc finger family protein [Saccharomyces cerevisiae]|nr:C2H2-type zinc finger family protein [Saccharomyces cerevisiae]